MEVDYMSESEDKKIEVKKHESAQESKETESKKRLILKHAELN